MFGNHGGGEMGRQKLRMKYNLKLCERPMPGMSQKALWKFRKVTDSARPGFRILFLIGTTFTERNQRLEPSTAPKVVGYSPKRLKKCLPEKVVVFFFNFIQLLYFFGIPFCLNLLSNASYFFYNLHFFHGKKHK